MSYADLGGVHVYTPEDGNPSFSLYDKHKACITITGTATKSAKLTIGFACGGRIMLFPSIDGKIIPTFEKQIEIHSGKFVYTFVMDFSGYTEVLPMIDIPKSVSDFKLYIEPSL